MITHEFDRKPYQPFMHRCQGTIKERNPDGTHQCSSGAYICRHHKSTNAAHESTNPAWQHTGSRDYPLWVPYHPIWALPANHPALSRNNPMWRLDPSSPLWSKTAQELSDVVGRLRGLALSEQAAKAEANRLREQLQEEKQRADSLREQLQEQRQRAAQLQQELETERNLNKRLLYGPEDDDEEEEGSDAEGGTSSAAVSTPSSPAHSTSSASSSVTGAGQG